MLFKISFLASWIVGWMLLGVLWATNAAHVVFAEASDTAQIVNAVVGGLTGLFVLIGTVFTGIMAFKMAKLAKGQKEASADLKDAATKVEQVAIKTDVIAIKTDVAAAKADAATLKSDTATAATDAKLDTIVQVGEKNHLLLNSSMGAALKLAAELSRWKAEELKSKPHVDASTLKAAEDAAALAEKNFAEHEAKQAKVDAKDALPAKKEGVS